MFVCRLAEANGDLFQGHAILLVQWYQMSFCTNATVVCFVVLLIVGSLFSQTGVFLEEVEVKIFYKRKS